jgi:hypothetical protein
MTIGAIPYVVVSLMVLGGLLMVLGMVMDYTLKADNDMMSDTRLPYSMERANTMGILALCFNAMGFVAIICAGILLVMNGVQSQSGEI